MPAPTRPGLGRVRAPAGRKAPAEGTGHKKIAGRKTGPRHRGDGHHRPSKPSRRTPKAPDRPRGGELPQGTPPAHRPPAMIDQGPQPPRRSPGQGPQSPDPRLHPQDPPRGPDGPPRRVPNPCATFTDFRRPYCERLLQAWRAPG
ncbi:hypothetical protein Sme01_16860 [Sphaerisporangium melleum]|nr:hypothetical protein Sme01_16860 [Sphaerisporangium melleum]